MTNVLVALVLLVGLLQLVTPVNGRHFPQPGAEEDASLGNQRFIRQHQDMIANIRGAKHENLEETVARRLMKKKNGSGSKPAKSKAECFPEYAPFLPILGELPVLDNPPPFIPFIIEDLAINDHFIGDGTNFGDRALWYDNVINNGEGELVGYSAGRCTVVAQKDTSEDGFIHSKCDIHFEFADGPLEGSTVLLSGIYSSGLARYTVIGGSGCFAGVTGEVREFLVTTRPYYIFRGVFLLDSASLIEATAYE